MTYQIKVQAATRTVCVTHEGQMDLADMESGRAQAVAALGEHGFSRLLVDARLVARLPTTTENHRFASTQPLYMPPHIAVAVVVPGPATASAPRELEKLSMDRGVQLRVFDDLDRAQAWLARITS